LLRPRLCSILGRSIAFVLFSAFFHHYEL
jgi:hypothetical protein